MNNDLNYQKYRKMIYKLAWSFHKTTGLDLEELVGEANVAFCVATKRHDSNRGTFSTCLYLVVSNALKDYCRKTARTPVSEELEEELPGTNNTEREYKFREFLNNLSSEAKDVVQTLFLSCDEVAQVAKGNHPNRIKIALKKVLISRKRKAEVNWSEKKIKQAYNEISRGLEVL